MKTDVLLVSMPFGPLFWPSIGLSLLKSGLARSGIRSRIRYFTFDFARRIGFPFYTFVSEDGRLSLVDLPGEWIFSSALFGTSEAEAQRYLDAIGRWHPPWAENTCAKRPSERTIQRLLKARQHAAPFLDECVHEIERAAPRVIGFTSMFQQHVPSLALARRIKEHLPDSFVVFGGPNCEGAMGVETVRQFSFVDAVVAGEGDEVLPQLARRVLDGSKVNDLAGVRTKENITQPLSTAVLPGAPMIRKLDELPYPDYDDYFRQFRRTPLKHEWQPTLLFETSRGCWWGERSHCTFCGLNGATMAYRSKSPQRAIAELTELVRRHPGLHIWVVDNILDMNYFRSFLPELARRRLGLQIYFETKSNLRRDQVRALRDAGVTRIQPGIESLSDSVLKLMRKGVTAFQNLQLLKWAKEFGVSLDWNFLWGFPGEDPAEYERMARMVRQLVHLPPPELALGILLDRFSPNFVQPDQFGFTQIEPFPSLQHIYPLEPEAVRNLAYHFTFQYREPRDVARYVAPLVKAIRWWKRQHSRSDLFSVDLGQSLAIWDLRPGYRQRVVQLHGTARALYEACDSARELKALVEVARQAGETLSDNEDVERQIALLLRPMVRRGLMIEHGSKVMSLAIPLGDYSPQGATLDQFYRVVQTVGTRIRRGWSIPFTSRPSKLPNIGASKSSMHPIAPEMFALDSAGNLFVRSPGRVSRSRNVASR